MAHSIVFCNCNDCRTIRANMSAESLATLRAAAIAKRKAAMLGPTEEGEEAEYRAMQSGRKLRAKLG